MFENFLAGSIILFRREMRIGDHIECGDIEGEVYHIAIRESHIRQTDGQLVIVPNSILFKNPVTIRTHKDLRRVTVMCGVAYDVDVDAARDVISVMPLQAVILWRKKTSRSRFLPKDLDRRPLILK